MVVSLLVPQVVNWGQQEDNQVGQVANWGEQESLTPDSDIDSGVFSQESGPPPRVDSSDGESDEDQRKEEEEEDNCLFARSKTPFTRRIWNRQNGWYRVRNPGAWTASTGQGRDLRAELEVMRREIAEMLDDTRELDERDPSDSRDCSETSDEEEEEDEVEEKRERNNRGSYDEEEAEEGDDTDEEEEEEAGDRELYYDFGSSDENEEEQEFQAAAASY